MSDDAATLLNDVCKYARERAWTDVVRVCDDVSDAETGLLLLAFAPGADRAPLEAFVRRAAPHLQVRSMNLQALGAWPGPLLRCGAMLTVFPSTLPSPADLEAAKTAAAALPRGLCAHVVIAGANVVAANDLVAVRRMAWGLFAPEPKDTWTGQSFEGSGVFVWCEPTSAMAEELALDSGRLATFVRSEKPPNSASSDWRMQALQHVLALAQAHVGESPAARPPGGAPLSAWRPQDTEARLQSRFLRVTQDLQAAWKLAIRAASATIAAGAGGREDPTGQEARVAEAMRVLRTDLKQARVRAQGAWAEHLDRALNALPWEGLEAAYGMGRGAVEQALALSLAEPAALYDGPKRPSGESGRTGAGGGERMAVIIVALIGIATGAALAAMLGGAAHLPALAHAAGPHVLHGHPIPKLPPPHLDVGRLVLGGSLGGLGGAALGYGISALRGGRDTQASGPSDGWRQANDAWTEQAHLSIEGLFRSLSAEMTRRISESIGSLPLPTGVDAGRPADPDSDAAAMHGWRERFAALATTTQGG